MSVHYKFKSALEFDTVTFDGLHISVGDLKKAILHQKKLSRNVDFDLQITNAQTKEVYTDESTLIAKNTSLIVARVPLSAQQKRTWTRDNAAAQLVNKAGDQQSSSPADNQDGSHTRLAKAVDLSSLDASEDDKIRAMMTQSTYDYDPSNYMRIKGASQMGEVPANYRCHKCHKMGHWIKNCPLIQAGGEPLEIKKSTGIPRSFMVPVSGPLVPGAMITPTGDFAVPAIDHEAYKEQKKERPPFQAEGPVAEPKPELPEDLVCSVCKDLLTDAVMIPCCGTSFCDECIRGVLLDSDEHECPDCKEQDVSPDTLIPNRFLRNAVNNFRNETGYNKQPIKIVVVPAQPPVPVQPVVTPAVPAQIVIKPEPAPTPAPTPAPAAAQPKPVATKQAESETTTSHIPVLGAVVTSQAPPGSSPTYSSHPSVHPKREREREARPPPPHLARAVKDFPPRAEERADTPTHDEPAPGPPRLPDLTLPPPNFAPQPQPPPAPPGVEESYMVSGVPPTSMAPHPMEYRPIESVVAPLMQTTQAMPHRYPVMPGDVPSQYVSRNYNARGGHVYDHQSSGYHVGGRGVGFRGRRGGPPGPAPPRGMMAAEPPQVSTYPHPNFPPSLCEEQATPLHGGGPRGYREREHPPLHNGKSDNIDALEEFNRILRERDRKLLRTRRTRSYSRSPPRRGSPRGSYSPRSPRSPRSRTPRSRTRSRSRSRPLRSPPPRSPRSRTRSRSRSRSFSLSRSPTPREFSPRRQKQPLVPSPRSHYRHHSRSPPPPPQQRFTYKQPETRSTDYEPGYDGDYYSRGTHRHAARKDDRDFFPQTSTETYRYQGNSERFDRNTRVDNKRFDNRERKQAPLRSRYDSRKENTERFDRYESRSYEKKYDHFDNRETYDKTTEQPEPYYDEPEVPGLKPPSLLDIDLKMPPSLLQITSNVEHEPRERTLSRERPPSREPIHRERPSSREAVHRERPSSREAVHRDRPSSREAVHREPVREREHVRDRHESREPLRERSDYRERPSSHDTLRERRDVVKERRHHKESHRSHTPKEKHESSSEDEEKPSKESKKVKDKKKKRRESEDKVKKKKHKEKEKTSKSTEKKKTRKVTSKVKKTEVKVTEPEAANVPELEVKVSEEAKVNVEVTQPPAVQVKVEADSQAVVPAVTPAATPAVVPEETAQLAEPDSSIPEPEKPQVKQEPPPVMPSVQTEVIVKEEVPYVAPVVIKEPEMLVPLPEPSRWEREEPEPSKWEKSEEGETSRDSTPTASVATVSTDKPQVTSEVLKRAENAIFKKAINAIRPERKERRSERKPEKKEEKPSNVKPAPVELPPDIKPLLQVVTNIVAETVVSETPSQAASQATGSEEVEARRSVKDRLGVKVENKTRDKERSKERHRVHARVEKPVSPVRTSSSHQSGSRRRERSRERQSTAHGPTMEVNIERRVVVEPLTVSDTSRRVVLTGKRKTEPPTVLIEVETKKPKVEKEKSSKHRKKSTDSKKKKEKRHHKKHKKTVKEPVRRKSTLDEATFEPDYDASTANESEPDKEVANGNEEKSKRVKRKESSSEASESSSEESSSSESSSDSSGESRKRSKHKKKKKSSKRRKRKSSSSGSESSSESEREKRSKKKKHKTKKKKKHHK